MWPVMIDHSPLHVPIEEVMSLLRTTLLILILITTSSRFCAADFFTTDNVAVSGNLSSTSHIGGITVVGGNLTGMGAVFAQSIGSTTQDTLIVGGSITVSSDSLDTGKLRYATSSFTPSQFNFNGGSSSVHDASVATIGQTLASQISTLSHAYNGMATTSTVTLPGAQPGPVTFNAVAGAHNTAVFTVDASVFSNPNSQSYTLNNFNAGETIVINVTGTGDVNFTKGNFTTGFVNNQSSIVWNFLNVTGTISVDTDLYGTILAPNATVSNVGGSNIEGGVFAANFNQGAEVHTPLFTGYEPVPEPSSLALLGMGFSVILAVAVRSRRRHVRA
jgi:choice-of-anchor A domain-containing protein